jgi:hypothetical protein
MKTYCIKLSDLRVKLRLNQKFFTYVSFRVANGKLYFLDFLAMEPPVSLFLIPAGIHISRPISGIRSLNH